MNTRTIRTIVASAAAISTLGLVGAGTASAKAGDIVKTGNCSGNTDWKFKVGARDGGFEYEYEVDSNVNGQSWNVRITDNGVVLMKGARTTAAPSGSFSVSGRAANRAGADKFLAKATNPATGETCTARISA